MIIYKTTMDKQNKSTIQLCDFCHQKNRSRISIFCSFEHGKQKHYVCHCIVCLSKIIIQASFLNQKSIVCNYINNTFGDQRTLANFWLTKICLGWVSSWWYGPLSTSFASQTIDHPHWCAANVQRESWMCKLSTSTKVHINTMG